jgi:hypothetical protein
MNADLVTGMFGEWGVDAPENFIVPLEPHVCDHMKEHMPADVYANLFSAVSCRASYDTSPSFAAGVDAYAAEIEAGEDHATAFDAVLPAQVAYLNANS